MPYNVRAILAEWTDLSAPFEDDGPEPVDGRPVTLLHGKTAVDPCFQVGGQTHLEIAGMPRLLVSHTSRRLLAVASCR